MGIMEQNRAFKGCLNKTIFIMNCRLHIYNASVWIKIFYFAFLTFLFFYLNLFRNKESVFLHIWRYAWLNQINSLHIHTSTGSDAIPFVTFFTGTKKALWCRFAIRWPVTVVFTGRTLIWKMAPNIYISLKCRYGILQGGCNFEIVTRVFESKSLINY